MSKSEAGQGLTYAGAGVDIAAGNRAVELIRDKVKSTRRAEVLDDIGGFGGLFALDPRRWQEPVLVSGTDGVGTKLRIAHLLNRHHTIGIDCVAMCVNDVLVHGAEPLFFLDYLAVGKMQPEIVAEIVGGVAEGCRQAGCALIGGETAEMPGFYPENEYDIAGFVVGIVERSRLLTGAAVSAGDVIIGLAASGLHSNGYSLARKALLEQGGLQLEQNVPEIGRSLGEELLEPTRIYVRTVRTMLEAANVHALCHVTGGGLVENLPRVLPDGLQASIVLGSWPILPVFTLIQDIGRIAVPEMFRTFNMGVGMVAVLPPAEVDKAIACCVAADLPAWVIGRVEAGSNGVVWA